MTADLEGGLIELQKFVDLLNQGEVVAIPTETVYGLAARIDLPDAIRKIFQVKERPFFDPLIVHVASLDQARGLVKSWPAGAEILAKAFWPGPLTLVLAKAVHVEATITSGLETVGVRMPGHPLALQLIEKVGVPLAAPSANKFGRTSPTSADHVRKEFGDSVAILDGGSCEVGIESTVLWMSEASGTLEWNILRQGAVSAEQIQTVLDGAKISHHARAEVEKKHSPGHMKHHYMPEIPLIFVSGKKMSDAEITREANIQIARMPDVVEGVRIRKPCSPLSAPASLTLNQDPALAARELYARLRELSQGNADHLIFRLEAFHKGGIWDAILDRLRKAASLSL